MLRESLDNRDTNLWSSRRVNQTTNLQIWINLDRSGDPTDQTRPDLIA
jgi:hypothetical protein